MERRVKVAKSLEKDNSQAAVSQLEALIHHIQALRGKKISEYRTDLLIDYSGNLTAQIAP